MPDPCQQENTIEHIVGTLNRMEKSQDDIVNLLKIVSNQTPRIEALETHSERTYTEMNELFSRMREVEMNAASSGPSVRQQFHEAIDSVTGKIDSLGGRIDKINRFINHITHKYALYTYGMIVLMIVAGTFLDFTYHKETLVAIIKFLKG